MNADGSGAARLTEVPNSTPSLSWSPDGSQVVHLLDGDLWTVPAARGTAREIVHLPESEMLRGPQATVAVMGAPFLTRFAIARASECVGLLFGAGFGPARPLGGIRTSRGATSDIAQPAE
jgi:hypothetical protein